MSKPRSIRLAIVAIFALLGMTFAAGAVNAHRATRAAASGRCHRCSCPGFQGVRYTCTRGGCGHHWDVHY